MVMRAFSLAFHIALNFYKGKSLKRTFQGKTLPIYNSRIKFFDAFICSTRAALDISSIRPHSSSIHFFKSGSSFYDLQ